MHQGETVINFAALQQARQGIDQNFKALQDTLERLDQELRPMVQTWEGDAREAYYQQKQKWDEAARNMSMILQRIGGAVGDTHDGWQTTEAQNASLFSGR